MELQLESLKYQDIAVQSVVKIFEGTEKNTFDNSCKEGIRSNNNTLSLHEVESNIKNILLENGISEEVANLSNDKDICVEMETGTGKTLVYVKTIYELFKHHGFTKFIILVPSVAIRQNIIGTFKSFNKQLESIYGFKPNAFEYDSKKLQKVTQFIEDQHPQVMIMTLASFNSEDKILNQAQREDLFNNKPFIEAIAYTNPIIIMDEPQEGMDTENSIRQIAKLNPLYKIRYSATHKVMKNLLYRLTPYDSYKDGLVKKIEVLTVTEKNDEATLKIELAEIQFGKGDPKVKLKAWHLNKSTNKIDFKVTGWLNQNDNLGDKTNNPSYLNYTIANINKSLKTGLTTVTFSNGTEILEKQISGGLANIWALQIEWLIHRHFTKSQKLESKGIKCLSLIFIDRVSNYMGETPIIKNLFIEKYKGIYPEYNQGKVPSNEHIQSIQGYYFAQKASGEFADNEGGVKEQSKIYELILKGKEELLTLSNPVQFVFSHSALGVGWDNPNVFNIATLNNSYSEIKKRQEIGRGLRICVNQEGQRIYDALDVDDNERINQLTVIPNETYETFVTQYQEEIKSVFGTTNAGAGMTHTHKGDAMDAVKFKRNSSAEMDKAFREYWTALAKKTEYTIAFDEENLITSASEFISKITIPDFVIEASSHLIHSITEEGRTETFGGTDKVKQKSYFTPLDLIEELSENTGLSYTTLFSIVTRLTNLNEMVKNPPRFIHEASTIIRNVELDEMIRGLDYNLTGESYPFDFDDFVKNMPTTRFVETPNKGVFDKMIIDSDVERNFSLGADAAAEVICFLKLPSWYKISTPIGNYEPDFGLVMKRKNLKNGNEKEFYFVIETKGTNDINDKKALTESEIYKIRCAMKHFEKLGLEVHYKAPVKEFTYFKTEADKIINAIM
ncbi:restriction endonuclease [Flavobacterium gawalongense]|uniref:DEAD/DEAH box helicase n=1 Tax=Flavobacterium gawalongense TaxID=2594432 RepID=A0A553BWC9_9FLAO|nr:DEAD/DEAH box helicase family protein [Flavobacterium gawalongense]TRX12529.1 DEAD/DEAH box helicase [Flavobacterium gawalongense]TRX12650.1 DEAD/DEAH box helicase [Flavobacterium gawalongense]TRX30561.1 DEAD/DEAH box helicase [Flavobacterium gawalongense]